MKWKILVATAIAGLFLGSSEELSRSSTMRRPSPEKAIGEVVSNSTAFANYKENDENNLFQASLPLDEIVREYCEELPWVLESDDWNKPSSDRSNSSSDFYSPQTLSKKGYYQLLSQPHLQAHRPFRSYGRLELLQRLNSAAEELYTRYGAVLQVHDLSRADGSYIPPHKSHRSGLDADVGIYWHRESNSKTGDSSNYGNSYGRPRSLDEKTLQINWDLIKALQRTEPLQRDLGSGTDGKIDFIFWNQKYIWAMRQFVQERYGNEEWRTYGKVLHHEPGHADHFHVRINSNDNRKKLIANK